MCSSTLDATSSANSVTPPSPSSRAMPTPVSSQDVSIAKTTVIGATLPRKREVPPPHRSFLYRRRRASQRLPTHDVGIGATDPVVPPAQANFGESHAAVQRDRRGVVGANL